MLLYRRFGLLSDQVPAREGKLEMSPNKTRGTRAPCVTNFINITSSQTDQPATSSNLFK